MKTLWLLILTASSFAQPNTTQPAQWFWKLSNGVLVPASPAWRSGGQVQLVGVAFDSAGLAAFPLNEKRIIGRTGPRGFVIDSLFIVGRATANSDTVKFDFRYSADISQAGTAIIAAPDTIAGVVPNTTTGSRRGTFTVATIPPNVWVFVAITKRTGAWKEISTMIEGHTP
jgi:hypothetical protein